jgi:hypothetical protein
MKTDYVNPYFFCKTCNGIHDTICKAEVSKQLLRSTSDPLYAEFRNVAVVRCMGHPA